MVKTTKQVIKEIRGVAEKFNQDHVPAGSSDGGQFTSGSGGSSGKTGGGKKESKKTQDSDKKESKKTQDSGSKADKIINDSDPSTLLGATAIANAAMSEFNASKNILNIGPNARSGMRSALSTLRQDTISTRISLQTAIRAAAREGGDPGLLGRQTSSKATSLSNTSNLAGKLEVLVQMPRS